MIYEPNAEALEAAAMEAVAFHRRLQAIVAASPVSPAPKVAFTPEALARLEEAREASRAFRRRLRAATLASR